MLPQPGNPGSTRWNPTSAGRNHRLPDSRREPIRTLLNQEGVTPLHLRGADAVRRGGAGVFSKPGPIPARRNSSGSTPMRAGSEDTPAAADPDAPEAKEQQQEILRLLESARRLERRT